MSSSGSLAAGAEAEGRRPASHLLEIRDLTVSFPLVDGVADVIRGVDLNVGKAERVALVGESGSGKSVTALTILGLVKGAHAEGEIWFDGVDLLAAPASHLRQVRGQGIGYVFQDALSSLNPLRTIGDQISEVLRIRRVPRKEAMKRTLQMLERVGLPEPTRRMAEYPHQLSGGMRQRAMIAMALVAEPQLIIADEPTTALDVRLQARILRLLRGLCEESGTAVLLITHDLGIVAQFAQRVVVMYAGRVMELGSTDDLFYATGHPYSRALLMSVPRMDGTRKHRPATIEGQPPVPTEVPGGCPFHPRCRYALKICAEQTPALEEVSDRVDPAESNGRHALACHLGGQLVREPLELPH